jgi:hypothetical protein
MFTGTTGVGKTAVIIDALAALQTTKGVAPHTINFRQAASAPCGPSFPLVNVTSRWGMGFFASLADELDS